MENERIPIALLCTHYNIETSFISSLTDYGLLEVTIVEEVQYIDHEKIRELEKLIQLHYELNINMEGIDAITHLLQKIDSLQSEVSLLKNKLRP